MDTRDDYYYNERYDNASIEAVKKCVYSLIGILICCFLIFLFSSCKTKSIVTEKETKDSVRIEYKEKIVKVPVTVYVTVPAEKHEIATNDTISFLETNFAKSTAKIKWKDSIPCLYHSLENKAQKIPYKDSVNVVEKETVKYKQIIKQNTRTITKEKTLTKLEAFYIIVGKIFLVICLLLAILLSTYILIKKNKFFFV